MATRQQLETALRNADAAGDIAAARQLAAALKAMPVEQPARDLDAERANVAEGMTLRPFGMDTGIPLPQGLAEGLAGAGRRLTQIATLGTNESQPEADRLLNESGYATAGGVAADALGMAAGGTVLKGAGALSGLSRLATAGRALQAPQSALQAVTAGGLYGAATSEDRASGGLGGALGGAAGYGVAQGVGRALAPQIAPETQELLRRNVKLTIGETYGGLVRRFEDGATSVFGVGDMIRHAKKVSLEDFNRAIYDEALSPIGVKLGNTVPVGQDAFQSVDDLIRAQYQQILPQTTSKMDFHFLRDIGKLRRMMKGALPETKVKQFDDLLNTHVLRIFKNQTRTAPGESVKEIDSLLGRIVRGSRHSGDYSEREFGNAVGEAQKAIKDLVARANPQASSQLRRIDAAYARLKPLEATLGNPKVQANGGVFTPNQLLSGVRQTTAKSRFARGRGSLQKSAKAGAATLPSTTPDSGTPYRAGVTAMIVAPGVLMNAPGTLAAGAGGMMAYTDAGQSLLRFLATQRTGGMLSAGNAMIQASPYAGMLGAATGLNTLR